MTRSPLVIEYIPPFEGLRLAVQSPPESSASACVSWVGPAGSGFDPRGKEGTALVTAQISTAGAGPYRRVPLARLLDRLGATLTHQVAPESAEFTVWGPGEEWKELLRILSLVALRPRLDAADVARVRRQLVERQLREQTQPSHRAERELLRTIFPPGHPYHETGLGTAQSLSRLTRADLVRFHRQHYLIRGSLLVVTAPASSEAIRREVRRWFAALQHAPPGPTLAVTEVRSRPVTRRIELAQRSQVDIRVGGPSLPRSAPAYPALFLAEETLGGRPLLSRLFQRVREHEGLAYHASSQLEAMRYGGFWVLQAGTSAANAPRALELLKAELTRLSTEPVPEAELDVIRESAIGDMQLSLESTADAHELAVELAYHGLPGDFWETWPGRLRSVYPAEVREAARQGLSPQRAVTVIAGPRSTGRAR